MEDELEEKLGQDTEHTNNNSSNVEHQKDELRFTIADDADVDITIADQQPTKYEATSKPVAVIPQNVGMHVTETFKDKIYNKFVQISHKIAGKHTHVWLFLVRCELAC